MKTKILQRLLPFVLFSFITTYAISQTATVGNYVWKDINANGLQDEPLSYGINGVSVQLWSASTNTLVSSTTTTNDGLGNSGYYSFTVYSSNNYYIKFATNYGSLNLTTTNNAANVDGNSDADYYTGNSSIFYLDINGSGTAKNNNTIDAGYYCNSGSNSISFNSNSSVYGVPTSPALGFNIFLENNGTFSSSECEGAVAMGGNLNINGDYACTIFPYFNYQVGGVNIGLLVGGQVNYNGGNRFAVNNNGYVKIGNQNGSAAWYIDQSGNQTPMRVTPNSNYYGSPRIEMTATSNSLGVNATNNPIFQSNLIDFADAFNKMRSYSTAMSNYANTIILTDNNNNSISTVGANGQVKITLGTGINVLNINGSDMNNITNFAYTNQPDATHQLIINVNASGSFNWNTWLNGSIGGITNCKYVIYNFYNTTNLNIAGYNGVQGCIYAPFADITKTTNNGTIDGQVVGKSYLQTAGGEVHYAIFNATVASQQIANVCNGGNVTLNANNASSYWWSTGATTQSINVASVGVYSVTSTNSSGCSSTSTITVTGNQGSITSYSWYDANDNGLQDEPVANGINGSTVELWSVGADRIYGTADDALVSTAVSANNASGNPGYAVFYVCASGDYYLKYPLAASSYGLTSKAGYTGGAGDSDPNGTTGKTTVFTIDINGTGTLKDNNTLGAGYISNCTKPYAGADISVCANAVATLTGTLPITGTWTQSSLNAAGATVSATTNGVATASFTVAGTYNFVYSNLSCRDTMQVVVKATTSSIINVSRCPSQMPYLWNGISRTTAGTYTYITTNSQGCDSVATLNLTVKTNTASTTNVSVCPSAMPYLWNGINRTTAGAYTYTTTNSQGCDSVATLNLIVKSNTASTTNVSICPSAIPYLWNGINRTTAGTYTYTTTNSQSCDSVATLNLTVKTNTTSTTNVSVCPSVMPYLWNGINRTTAGTYTYTTTNSQGCDSVATLNLTVKSNTTSTTNISICPSAMPYMWNGINRTTAGTYTFTTTNSQGCDSVATLNLTVKTNTTSTTNVSICPSQLPYSWNGSRTSAGTYTYTTTNSQGCDSVATLNLTVKTNTTSTTNVSICPSQLPYNWNGSRTTAGTYTYTTTNSQGCDSVATLNLTVKTNTTSTTNVSICPSQLPYSWNGSRTTAGTYTYTTTNSQGCDSVATLNLTVKTNTTSTTNVSICPSQLPYNWNGSRTTAGTYTYTTTNSQGCDSVATLNLTVKTNTTSTTNVSVCPSQMPYLWNGINRTTAGTYTYTTTNSQGCDSVATLNLTVKTNTTSTTNVSICPSALPYLWNGVNRTTAGTYTYTTTNSQGCDSVATLNLTVKTNTASTTNVSICPSAMPYLWNGINRTTAGTYTYTTTNSQGCDSVATLNLTVKTNTASTTNVSICPSAMPYLWNGINRTTAGTYTYTTTNSQGCDSVATLNLTVKTNTTSTTNVSICPSQLPYSWNGSRNAAGTYTYTTTNSQGCDSVATLNLTVKSNTTSTTNISVCAAKLPFVWNGTSYSTSGNYTYTTANSQGCDSIATLNLTVTPSGSIGNYYWWDLDNNGLQNEPAKDGINGVMLYLYKDNGTGTMLLVDSTITANDVNGNPGYYNFTICNSGNYQVKFPTIYGGEILTVQTPVAGVDGNSDADVATGFSPIFTMNLLGTGLQVNNNTIDGGVDPCTQPCAGPNDTTCANSCVSIKGHSVFVGSWSALPTNPSGATLTSITTDSAVVCFSNSAAGIYYFVYTLTGGCSDTMNVTVNATTTSNTNVIICSTALPYTWNATNYNATGIYTKTFVNANGCDSVATLNLTVNNCLGSLGDYVWYDINRNGIQDNRINPLTNAVLGAELPVPNIKIYLLNATTNAKLDSTYTNTNGYYLFNNLVAGTYKIGVDTTTLPAHFAITIPNATSNDSIDNDVYPNLYTSDAVTLAANQHITTLDAGIYIHSTLSIVDPCACFNRYFNANQNREFIETLTVTSAPGEVWYVASHTGMKVLDSVSTAALPINTLLTPVVGNPSQYTIQFADENGIGYTGIFTNGKDTLTRSNLCYLPDLKITNTIDSICKTAATITLSAKVLLNNVDVTNGNITFYTATNWHNNNKLNDATLTPISTFNPANYNVGDTVTIAVIYTPNNVAECPIKKVFTIKIMDCNASIGNYVWLDVNQDGIQNEPTANGINGLKIYLYKETSPNVFVVVDSTITANDTANKPGYYLFTNLTNGNYKVKFPTSYLGNGLTTQDSSTTTDFNSDANKQTGFTIPFSINVTATGFLKNNITIDAGYLPCSKPNAGNDTSVCKGACITLYGTNTINGVWSQLSSNAAGAAVGSTTFGASTICFDSTTSGSYYFIYKVVTCTDTVKINIKQPTSSIVNASVCSNNVPYSWMGFNVSTPGDYTYHTYNAAGCDSAVTLHLTFKQPSTITYDTVVSQRILPYVWHTANFNYADTITLHFTNSVGCDSLVVLQLRTLPVDTTIINDTLCSTTAPYTFNGTNYYGGTFNVFLTKTNGGDSLIILNLTDTCSTVTGGGGGGLESKSLGDVIAQRLYGNAVNSKLEVDGIKNGKLFTAPVVTLDGVGGVDLQSVTPKSLAGTDAAYVSTPTNLTNFTNIVDVFAVDYAKGKNVKAVVFGTKTLGSMYSHTKAVCDRLKGAKILEIKTIDVNGYGIIAYKIQQCTGEVEYAMNMTAGINNNDSIISLQNNWNVNNYQSYASMYNFQLWANSYVMVQNLAANIIAKLKSFSTVKTINSVDIPKVYIANGNRNNSVISLDINNTTAATTAVIQWKQKNVEGGIETNYSKQISLQPFATTTVQLNVGDSYESVINLWMNNKAVDMMYLNDGTWAADYNTTKTTLQQFKVTNETSVTTATNEYKLLRNVSFTATTNDYVTAYKTIGSKCNALNLANYNSLKFNANATGASSVTITLISNNIQNWKDQYVYTQNLTTQQEYSINLNQFKSSLYNAAINSNNNNPITSVSFAFNNGRGVNSTMNVNLSNTAFSKQFKTQTPEASSIVVYPNPLQQSTATVAFNSPSEDDIIIKVVDMLGKVVYTSQAFKVATGKMSHAIALNNMQNGIYIVQLISSQNSYTPTKLVVNR